MIENKTEYSPHSCSSVPLRLFGRLLGSTIVTIFILHQSVTSTERPVLTFFGSPTCKECMRIKNEILFPAQKRFPNIDLHIYDVTTDSGFNRLMDMEDAYQVSVSSAIELFLSDTFLTGAHDIFTLAPSLISKYEHAHVSGTDKRIVDSSTVTADFGTRLAGRFSKYSFLSIFAAGIVDGVNPCAIATMIFLISFLATQKRRHRDILIIGLAFTATVFCTYLMMGIGAFKALSFLSKYTWVSTLIRLSAALLAVVVGVLSFRDAFVFRTTKKTKDIKLQLPKAIKTRIHRVISGNLSGRHLVIGAIVTGFLVTLLEAVCTGQVYLPTIILMTRHEGLRLTGWMYLLFYNILFVLPLLVVMVLAFFGLRWERLAKTTQQHMVAIKAAIGVLLCSLAVFIFTVG